VENHSDRTHYLIRAAADPNYFSPLEAAFAVHGGLSKTAQTEMENHFRSMSFRNPISPNTAVSGFIFTNLDEGEKVVQVDLFASQQVKVFTFFVQVPGIRVDYRMVDFDSLYVEEEIIDLDQDRLRAALEKLPCCTTDKEEMGLGDPLNLVIIGNFVNVAATFARRGWLPAEDTYSTAVWKTIKSFLFGSRYRYSPVSSLYFFGRHQDFARQKPRHDIHERNHLRLWYSQMRFEGKPVFVGQVSRDIGVRFIPITGPGIDNIIEKKHYYTMTTVPVTQFYQGADDLVDVKTFGVIATLCSSIKVPVEIVYTITKEVFDNFEEFKRQHSAYATLSKESMLKRLTAPLHPGAIRYFMEAGLMK
jgi:hypothetical protein